MANISINKYVVKSNTEKVLNFINEGLKNLNVPPKKKTLKMR